MSLAEILIRAFIGVGLLTLAVAVTIFVAQALA